MTTLSALSTLSPLLTPTPASTASGTSTASTQATAATDPVSLALQQAQQRIETQVDATIASLSAYGKLQSAVSDTQLAASALGKLGSSSSDADVQAAANDFVSAYNTAVGTAAGMAGTGGSSTTESRSAARVGRDLDMALTNDSATAQALSAVGITRQADGSLAIDAKKFAAAQQSSPDQVRSALAGIGQAVDQASSSELASGGAIGDPLSALSDKSKALIAQQNAFQAAVQKLEDNMAQAGGASGSAGGAAGIAGMFGGSTGFTGYGLSAYIANS